MARGVRNDRIIVPRPKAGRSAGFESTDSVATLARLRDSGNRAAVRPRQCLASGYPRILCWVCGR